MKKHDMFRGFILACLCAGIASYPLNPPPTERSDAYTLIFQEPAGFPPPYTDPPLIRTPEQLAKDNQTSTGVLGVLSTTSVALGDEPQAAAVRVSIANWSERLAEKTSHALRSTPGRKIDGEQPYWAVALTYTTEHPLKALLYLVAFGFLVKMMIWVIPNLVNIIMQLILLIPYKMMMGYIRLVFVGIISLVNSILVVMMRCVSRCLGFGVLGPIRGSFAAAWQSACYAGFIARGSVFACLQSIGMIWR